MRNLRSTSVLLAVVLGAAGLAAEPFARLTGGYVHFHNADFDDRAGYALALGTTVGEAGTHELGLEFGGSEWDYRKSWTGDVHIAVVGFFDSEEGNGNVRPLVATYRYFFGAPTARLRWHVGVTVGMAQVEGEWLRYPSEARPFAQTAAFDRWRLAYGAGVGMEYTMGKYGAIELSYRYQAVEGFDTGLVQPPGGTPPAVGSKLNFPTLRVSSVQLGYTYRF